MADRPSAVETEKTPAETRVDLPQGTVCSGVAVLIVLLAGATLAGAQSSSQFPRPVSPGEAVKAATKAAAAAQSTGPIDILSETNGFDMNRYLKQVMDRVRTKWYQQIPDSAKMGKKGAVSVKFRVMKNGDVSNIRFDSNSGDAVLDRSAYGAVAAASPLDSLPNGFACEYVDLRFRFYYNPDPGEVKEQNSNDQRTPCVTSKIKFVKVVGVSVSPGQARIAVGTKQPFYATVVDTADSAVSWTLSGAGCEGSACGVISPDGVYTAPSKVPNPPTISLTATLTSSPSNTASSVITLVENENSH